MVIPNAFKKFAPGCEVEVRLAFHFLGMDTVSVRMRYPLGWRRTQELTVPFNSMLISEQEDKLFERWRSHRPQLVRDGLVNEAAYVASSPRVVLVLKEVNDKGGGGWDLRDVLQEGKRWQTWNTVTRWMRGLRKLDRDLTWPEIQAKPSEDERRCAVRSLCVIILKKEPGGSSSDRAAVHRYANEDSAYLREQFDLYDPDLVICGGVGEVFRSVIDARPWQRTSRGVRYVKVADSYHVIDYYHPQARYPLGMLYFTLIDAVRELRGYS